MDPRELIHGAALGSGTEEAMARRSIGHGHGSRRLSAISLMRSKLRD